MNVVITGATKGLGRALAIKFASHGHSLAICSRHLDDLRDFKSELLHLSPSIDVLIAEVDISRKEEVQRFGQEVKQHFGVVDVLINNGGIFIPGAISTEADGQMERMMETNLYSAYYLTRALLPCMISSEQPHIFNMCSIASFMAYPNGGSYTLSKFALLGFSKVLREEMKTKGIKVTAIMPGATWTHSWEGADYPEDRLMQPEDVADTVWAAYQLGPSAVVEEIIIRPQLGDL